MKFLSHRQQPERRLRVLLRQKKWKKASIELAKVSHADERNYATWNTIGDVHFLCKSSKQSVEAWRRAAEGYAREGLYENALALTKKIIRLVPEETDLSLMLAELYLNMGYDADALASLRTYLRLCPQPSEPGLRAFFRKIIESNLYHTHLLEELMPLFREAKIEDRELQKDLEQFVTSRKGKEQIEKPESPEEAVSPEEEASLESTPDRFRRSGAGLVALDMSGDDAVPFMQEQSTAFATEMSRDEIPQRPTKKAVSETAESPDSLEDADLPGGEGRDHYDLGMVYQEMKLWDAAIGEFEQARRDSDFHMKAELALAECLMEKGDPRQALELLENFEKSEEQPLEEKLRLEFVKGQIQEALGNLSQALTHFETIYGHQATYADVEKRIRALKERIVEEGRS